MSQNRYEVLGKIADGGLGSVYKAYDRNLRREVALKRVRAETPEQAEKQAEQLMDEARNLSTLQHPHIVTIFDVGRDEEGAYIIMELLKGETLEDIIGRGALAEHDFRELVTQSLEGMIAAHSAGMIHLDIKPQNFMVIWLPSGKFQIKILDFGLAKVTSQPAPQEMDEEGAIMGSIYFMAPEQFERSPLDARTDLYSLGCVYYYALTQHYPFQGETGAEVMASHMYHSFIPLSQLRPDLPPFVHEWVEWLMNRLPDHRPGDAAQAYEIFRNGEFPSPVQVVEAEEIQVVEADIEPGTITSPLSRPAAPRPGIHRPAPGTGPIGHRPVPKPVARPVNIATAIAPSHLRHRKPWPKWIVFGIPAFIVAILVAIVATQALRASRRNARFDELARMEKPAGAPGDVRLLLRMIEQQPASERAGQILGRLEGVEGSNTLMVARFRQMKSPWGKKNLALALAQRGLRDAVEPLLLQLTPPRTPESDTRIAIWSALGRLGSSTDVAAFLERLKGASPDELRAIESALVNAARSEPDPSRRGVEILNLYTASSSGEDEQAALLRALGRIGNRAALPEILKALKSPNPKLRFAAVLGAGDWPTAEPIPALLELIAAEREAITSIGKLAPLSGDLAQEEIARALIAAFNAAKDSRAQNQILAALARVADPGAAAFLADLADKDARRKPEASAGAKSITAALAKAVPVGDGTTTLAADQATLTVGPLTVHEGVITNWLGLGDHASWLVKLDKPGPLEIQLNQSAHSPVPGRYLLTFGRESFVKSTAITGNPATFRTVTIGTAIFTKPGLYRLWIRPLEIPAGSQLMRIKEAIIIRPAG